MSEITKEERELMLENKAEARQMIEAASLLLMRYRPFYGVMMASMPTVESTASLPTAATDGRNLLYNVEFIAGISDARRKMAFDRIDNMPISTKKAQEIKNAIDVLYKKKTIKEVVFILEHEIRHIVSSHLNRTKGFDPEKFNIAADHAINTSLVLEHSENIQGLSKPWFKKGTKVEFKEGEEFGFMTQACCDFKYAGWIAEEVYIDLFGHKALQKKKEEGGDKGEGEGDSSGVGTGQHMDENGRVGGSAQKGEGDKAGMGDINEALGIDPSSGHQVTDQERKANEGVMRRAIDNATRSAGAGAPEEARKFVEEMGSPKINYLRLLRRSLESKIKNNVSFRKLSRRSHSLTYSLRRRGMLSKRQMIALPSLMNAKTVQAHIFFDVSGSFHDGLLAPVKREILGLCKQYDEFQITLACWSTKLGEVKTYSKENCKEIHDYHIKTTGGTNPMCIFNYLDELKEPTDQAIIFTDGYFQDLSQNEALVKKYGNKVLWIILGSHNFKPPFGKCIMFDEYVR